LVSREPSYLNSATDDAMRFYGRERNLMKNHTDVLNAKEAAAYLKAHVETIRRMARRVEIPAFKVGKDWRFHRGALLRWIEGHNPKPSGA
jgi:excisionase family DNA binding protein